MQLWYVNRTGGQGLTDGPYDRETILREVRAGSLRLIDLVYSEAVGEWRLVGQYLEFREALIEAPLARALDETPRWVFANADGSAPEGPLTDAEIKDFYLRRRLADDNLLWCEGDAAWLPVARHLAFHALLQAADATPLKLEPSIDVANEDLLASVARLERAPLIAPQRPRDPEIPAEADGIDLIDLAKGALLAFLLCVVPGFARAEAARLIEIEALKSSSEKPILVFNTNAPPGEAILVTLTARSGEILKLTSYRGEFSVTRVSGEIPTLALPPMPAGTYEVEAKSGEALVRKSIFLGKSGPGFDAELARHWKQISFQQQREKKALFYTAEKLETLARELGEAYSKSRREPKAWQKSFASFQRSLRDADATLRAFQKQPAPERAYPTELAALDVMRGRLAGEGSRLNDAISQKREIAEALPLATLTAELGRLRDEAAELQTK